MELEEVLNNTIKSTLALISRSAFLLVIQFVAYFLLGIFLQPAEFGMFIAVSAIVRVFTLFADIGLGGALIQKKEDLDLEDLKTTFTIQEIIILLVLGVGFALTPFVRQFAHLNTDGVFLYQVLLATLFISSLKVVPSILLERKLAFEKQVIPQIFESLTFHLLVVFLAYKGFGIASYSWAILASSIVGLPIYFFLSPWKVSLGISAKRARALVSFGIAYQGKTFLAVIKDDLLTAFLASLVGPSGLGYWGWAQKWAYAPFRLIVDSVTKVTFPAYSRVQENLQVLQKGIERSLFVVSNVLFPTLTLLAVLAQPALQLLPRYHKWQPALPSFYFLLLGAAASALSNILVNALDATGKVKTTLKLMVGWIIGTWLLTFTLVPTFGFTGIALASFLVSLSIVLTIYLVRRVVPFDFFGNVWKATVGSLFMGIVGFTLSRYLEVSFPSLIFISLCSVIIYFAFMTALARHELIRDLKIVIKAFRP